MRINGTRAAFLSGNQPLVTVLKEALARDKVEQKKSNGDSIRKEDAIRETASFIQIIHKYRDSFVGNKSVPPENVVIFDEAQRAWTVEKIKDFMFKKKKTSDFRYSEPEFLINTMDRHSGWAVIVCLIGGGQEIHDGEAGLPEWFDSLRRNFTHWKVYVTPELDAEYRRDRSISDDLFSGLDVFENEKLHLSSSIRSFRTPDVAAFINALLDVDIEEAGRLFLSIKDKYPIFLTRNLTEAKKWVRERSKGTEQYGMIACSGALRLKTSGLFVKNKVNVANWFLNGKDDIRSCYYLEDAVTEYGIQGLEIDYTIVVWDADFRFDGNNWTFKNLRGTKWEKVEKDSERLYLKNTYRVLLTRARQGMAIFIPEGSDTDATRKNEFYDETYKYLSSIMHP